VPCKRSNSALGANYKFRWKLDQAGGQSGTGPTVALRCAYRDKSARAVII